MEPRTPTVASSSATKSTPSALTSASTSNYNVTEEELEAIFPDEPVPPPLLGSPPPSPAVDERARSPPPPAVEYTTSLSWRPRAEQMGGRFELCFRVTEANDLVLVTAANHTERCFVVHVGKCRKCLSPGESLDSIARSLASDWRLVWSANHAILNPSSVAGGRLIKTSLAYKVVRGDSLASVAMRFGTTVRALLDINPDLALGAPLADGAVVCVLPMPTTLDDCPTPAKSSTWERLEEQYIAPDYYDNPFNWEYITYDEQGLPHKTRNPDYPQLPAIVVDEQPGYSTQ